MRRIASIDDISEGLEALCLIDPRLAAIRARVDEVPLRLSEPGFHSLASIIVSQQVSTASARAIFGRFTRLVDPLTPDGLLGAGDDVFREAGLSRPKQKTLLRGRPGGASTGSISTICAGSIRTRRWPGMVAVSGIGPWTAEVYLLFAAGHPDIFPARDVALQTAVGHALGMEVRPGEKALIAIAESWRPWRGVASRLFWAYYRTIKGRDAVPTA